MESGSSPQDVCHLADVKAGQPRVAGQEIQHEHASSLHDTVRGEFDGLKRAEINQGHLFVRTSVPLGACQAQNTVEEELRARMPHKAVPLYLLVLKDSTGFGLLG